MKIFYHLSGKDSQSIIFYTVKGFSGPFATLLYRIIQIKNFCKFGDHISLFDCCLRSFRAAEIVRIPREG